MDQISIQRIAKLHPKLRAEALVILQEIEAALTGRAHVRFSFTLRTDAEQNALYAQGRTKPGQIVTNAKAGQSLHNYGLAVDIAFIVDTDGNGTFETSSWDTKTDFDHDRIADWNECVAIFKKHGWEWGGNWITFKDLPHFQKTFGKSLKQLKLMKRDAQGYVIF